MFNGLGWGNGCGDGNGIWGCLLSLIILIVILEFVGQILCGCNRGGHGFAPAPACGGPVAY
ncbi:MAG: hypothetical protein FWE85_01080 [Clostridiales bacterium]|nr:hypothetical protein [Clostridiales bacterium]